MLDMLVTFFLSLAFLFALAFWINLLKCGHDWNRVILTAICLVGWIGFAVLAAAVIMFE